MTETNEACLQKLIEEEKVIQTALKLVKSRFLQLQVEHMGLKIAQKNLLLKCNNASSTQTVIPISSTQTKTPISNELSGQKVLNTDKRLSLVNEVSEVSVTDNEELDSIREVENVSENCATDGNLGKIFSEKELDDPVVMNQMELDLNVCLGSVTDNHFANERSLKGFLEPDFDDNSLL